MRFDDTNRLEGYYAQGDNVTRLDNLNSFAQIAGAVANLLCGRRRVVTGFIAWIAKNSIRDKYVLASNPGTIQ